MRLTEILIHKLFVSLLFRHYDTAGKYVFSCKICVCKNCSTITPWISFKEKTNVPLWENNHNCASWLFNCSEVPDNTASADCAFELSENWCVSHFIISCSSKSASPSQKTECPLLQPGRQLSRQPAATKSSSSSDPRCLRLCWWCSGSRGTRSTWLLSSSHTQAPHLTRQKKTRGTKWSPWLLIFLYNTDYLMTLWKRSAWCFLGFDSRMIH